MTSVAHVAAIAVAAGLATMLAVQSAAGAEAASPLAPDAVAERIQKHRTCQVTLTVLGTDGKPLSGAAVTVRQVRHKFLFGCNAFRVSPADTSDLQRAYQERFAALLNYATLPFYWGAFEPVQGRPEVERLRAMAQWCKDRSIRTKGHPLCWHEVVPRWLTGKPPEEVSALALGRISREVGAFAGLVDTWDVVNEAVATPNHQPDANPIAQWCRKVGRVEYVKQTFAAARAAGAGATLVLNDFDTSPRYEALIKECLGAGVGIDVIGIQSHMHGGYWGAQKTWDVCERFARFGKPLHFTEVTVPSGEMRKNINWQGRYDDWASTPEGEKRQAEQVAEFYRILFSHPAVEAVTWWDFSDRGAWLGAPAGLVRKDMSPKPAYDALMQMIKKEWWTGPLALTTGPDGKVGFRAFLGQYEVESAAGRGTFALGGAGVAAITVRLGGAM